MPFGDFAIAPSTTVTLCKGVPLVKGSEDTLYFASAGVQASTISSFGFATFTQFTYQRNTRNVIRIGLPMGVSGGNSAIRANYCIFNNSAFEGKNIYCFVDSVDYVNNNTIDVTFTVDPVQTFMFDYELKQCYVEREHSVTDEPGDNVVPEEFGTLPTVIAGEHRDFIFSKGVSATSKYMAMIYYIENCGVGTDGTVDMLTYDINGQCVNNIYSGCNIATFAAENPQGVDHEIELIIHNGGTIVGIQMIPPEMVIAAISNNGVIKEGEFSRPTYLYDRPLGNYTPKNKKLLTYPYQYLTVSNNLGEEKQYRWEWFTDAEAAKFRLYGAYLPSPDSALVPLQYQGMPVNYANRLSYNTFPTGTWNEDSFQQWWMRNGNSYNASVNANNMSTAVGAISGAVVGAAVGAKFGPWGALAGGAIGATRPVISGVTNHAQIEASFKDQVAAPDKLAGSPASAVVNEVIGNTGFTVFRINIPVSMAKSIDDYFTMYGYATKRVKQPNISSRPVFNYVKTHGCTIYGDIPAPYALEIQERFNSGIRFWKTTDVGNYTLNNMPE